MKTTIATLGLVFLAALAARGGDVQVVLDSTNGTSSFRVLDQASNQLLDVQSGTVLRLGRTSPSNQLDQQQMEFTTSMFVFPTDTAWQSFTVGRPGRLSQILWWNDHYAGNVDTGLIRLRAGEGTGGSILWSKTVTWNDYWLPIDVDTNIVVSEGDVFTIEIQAGSDNLQPGYAEANPYSRGTSSEGAFYDFLFATYVTPISTNPPLVSVPAGNFGIGTEPTAESERLTVAGNVVATGSVNAAAFVGSGAGLTNIGSSALAAGAVTSSKIAAGAVQGSNLATFAVTSNKIMWGEVHAEALADGAVTASKIAVGAVGTAALANDAVDSSKIAPNAVGPTELNDGSVQSSKLASVSVSTSHLMSGAVTSGKIADNAVLAQHLAGEAVTTAKIGTFAVTAIKLANDAVTTDKLTNNAVTATKLANGACLAELADNDGAGSGLDADLLDGLEIGNFTRIQASGLIPAGTNFVISLPHFIPFALQVGCEHPHEGGVAQICGFENDSHVGITFQAYHGNGTSTNGGSEGIYGTGVELLQFGDSGYRYVLRCNNAGPNGLELSTTNSALGAYYRLIY